jgi:hypothetical protein
MAQSHVLSVLIEKHAEIAGVLRILDKRVAQYRADLMHIEATMKLLDTDFDPGTIEPKRPFRRTRYFKRNELSNLCLSILRRASGALATQEITTQIMLFKGFDQADPRVCAMIAEQVNVVLRSMRKRGVLERKGLGKRAYWSITD